MLHSKIEGFRIGIELKTGCHGWEDQKGLITIPARRESTLTNLLTFRNL